jgi:hypothetical protein
MRMILLVLAALAFQPLTADTQKSTAPAVKESPATKQKDIIRFLTVLGMPQANSEAARKQITAASKDPKLAGYPAAYWKDYLDAAAPETFEKLLSPIFDKAYSHDEIKSFLKLFATPEFQKAVEKNPEGYRLFMEKHPGMLRAQAFESFSSHMTEVGKKLQQKHGIKAPEPKK